MTVQSNIWKLYVIKASKWLMLYMPTIFLFYEDNGMDLGDIMLLQGIYSVAVALIEIPSGYVGDVVGRKNSLIIGTGLGVLGFIIYSFGHGFWDFIPAVLCLGMGQSFLSGSDTALMYDSLYQVNRIDEFVKLEGRTISMGNFAEAVAAITGGLIAEISHRMPFYFQIGVAAIGFLIALSLVEPDYEKLKNGKN